VRQPSWISTSCQVVQYSQWIYRIQFSKIFPTMYHKLYYLVSKAESKGVVITPSDRSIVFGGLTLLITCTKCRFKRIADLVTIYSTAVYGQIKNSTPDYESSVQQVNDLSLKFSNCKKWQHFYSRHTSYRRCIAKLNLAKIDSLTTKS